MDELFICTNFQICRIAVLGENGGESLSLFQVFTNSVGNNFYVGKFGKKTFWVFFF